MIVDFTYYTQKLKASFEDITDRDSDVNFTRVFDFGDGKRYNLENNRIEHTFDKMGRYEVKLMYFTDDNLIGCSSQYIMVSDRVNTTLTDTIYVLIDSYLPQDIFGNIDTKLKKQMIRKWQLYLSSLVNHKITPGEEYNEFSYEALENELIMELAAYDYMVLKVNQMIQKLSQNISSSSSSSSDSSSKDDNSGNVKHITTGPSEVEFFNPDDFTSDVLSNIIKAMNPDGVMALLKQQICMLSTRLDIYLPICQRVGSDVIVPKVVNRRINTFLSGPDPKEILK